MQSTGRLVVGMVLAALVAACDNSSQNVRVRGPDTAKSGAVIYIFHDRMAPVYEWLIVVVEGRTFVQKAAFPGYADRVWYEINEDHSRDEFCRTAGERTPPFVPGGPNLSRATISAESGEVLEESYFKDENPAFKQFRANLQKSASSMPPIKELPSWVSGQKKLMFHLGM